MPREQHEQEVRVEAIVSLEDFFQTIDKAQEQALMVKLCGNLTAAEIVECLKEGLGEDELADIAEALAPEGE